MMNRQEAINNLISAWTQRDGEYCVGDVERAQSDAEMRESLKALGVTDEEIDAPG